MSVIEKRAEIYRLSKQRMKLLNFADAVTNICAGENNPSRLCYFVRYKPHVHVAECTDKNGWFGNIDADVIFNGHLSLIESNNLFQPVWEATYAKE